MIESVSAHDDVVRLRLVEPVLAGEGQEVPTYRFVIESVESGEELGGINLRAGVSEEILTLRGQVGFTVKEEFRRKGFARRAFRLVVGIAAELGMAELWVTCDPGNVASRGVVESGGAVLVETVPVPRESRFFCEGSREKCRYRVSLAQG